MEKWEYTTVTIGASMDWQTNAGFKKPALADEEFQGQLNSLGKAGWECVSVVADEWHGGQTGYTVSAYRAILKRRQS